jgi:hypothetical protein
MELGAALVAEAAAIALAALTDMRNNLRRFMLTSTFIGSMGKD